jgi:hypothetical protein
MTQPNREAPSRADRATPPPTPPFGPIVPVVASDDSVDPPAGHTYLPKHTPTRQFAALFLVPVRPDEANVQQLKSLLETISQQTAAAMRGSPNPHALLPFQDLVSVHYARVLLIDHWAGLGPMLALATDYDGPEGEAACGEARAFELHLGELLRLQGGLNQLFRRCSGYAGSTAQLKPICSRIACAARPSSSERRAAAAIRSCGKPSCVGAWRRSWRSMPTKPTPRPCASSCADS